MSYYGQKYPIEKGIEPPLGGSRTKQFKYPFHLMEVGDSFLIPCADEATEERAYRRMAALYGRHKPKRFKCRKVDGGVRVWRIE